MDGHVRIYPRSERLFSRKRKRYLFWISKAWVDLKLIMLSRKDLRQSYVTQESIYMTNRERPTIETADRCVAARERGGGRGTPRGNQRPFEGNGDILFLEKEEARDPTLLSQFVELHRFKR